MFGFTSMLIKVMQDEKPDYIACCLDMAAPLERSETFAEYKSNRSTAPDTFTSQIPLVREVLKVLHIPIYELPGHEADDIIAFIAKRVENEVDVRIVTGDRDFFQLANKRIHVLYNRRGISDIVEMDPKAVEERYGVPPERHVDLKALEGDNSDNLPGVPGVGTKTAAKLVQKYGSAEEAVAHASEQTPKLAQNLAAHAEQVSINKKLSTLASGHDDLVANLVERVGLDDMQMGSWDMEEVRELFKSLEFRVLLERLMSDLPESAEGEGDAFEVDVAVFDSAEALGELAEHLKRAERFAVDIVPATPRGVPRSFAFSWGEGHVGFVPVGPQGVTLDQAVTALRPILEDEGAQKVVHGGRSALLSLNAAGIGLRGLHLDTHVGTYLLDPGAPGYALEEMARKYSGRELKAIEGVERDPDAAQGSLALDGDPVEVAAEDASLRALAVTEIANAVEPELARLGMDDLYRTIEHPLIPVLAGMEEIGIKIDLDYLAEIGRDLEKRISELETECYELAGERINLGSPTQLRVLLYEKLGLKTTRRTKTGLSTDARALQQLVEQHEFVPKLLEYRELAKLKNTYIDALPPLVDELLQCAGIRRQARFRAPCGLQSKLLVEKNAELGR